MITIIETLAFFSLYFTGYYSGIIVSKYCCNEEIDTQYLSIKLTEDEEDDEDSNTEYLDIIRMEQETSPLIIDSRIWNNAPTYSSNPSSTKYPFVLYNNKKYRKILRKIDNKRPFSENDIELYI